MYYSKPNAAVLSFLGSNAKLLEIHSHLKTGVGYKLKCLQVLTFMN